MKLHRVLTLAIVAGLVTATAAYAANRIWSPYKVTRQFVAKHFKIGDVRRRGSTYLVLATGPKGNQVRFVVDGKSGKVRGMDVVRWARGARRIKRGSHGVSFYNEYYEFGVTVPVAVYTTWTDYNEVSWTTTTEEYVEVTTEEYSEEISVEEVTFEEDVTEVSEESVETEESDAADDGPGDDAGDDDAGHDDSGDDDGADDSSDDD